MVRLNSKGEVVHNAKFSRTILDTMNEILAEELARFDDDVDVYVLDPMAGVGGIMEIADNHPQTIVTMIEIEEEWADVARLKAIPPDRVIHTDFLKWAESQEPMEWDVVITSPTYGNRMADSHTPGPDDHSTRNTYRHVLGRPLTKGSSAGMQWGEEYRDFHTVAWSAVYDLLAPTGIFVLNVKDHIRGGVKQPVCMWHKNLCIARGFQLHCYYEVPVKGNRQGQNGQVRVDNEMVYVFRKPAMDLSKAATKWTQPRFRGMQKGEARGAVK